MPGGVAGAQSIMTAPYADWLNDERVDVGRFPKSSASECPCSGFRYRHENVSHKKTQRARLGRWWAVSVSSRETPLSPWGLAGTGLTLGLSSPVLIRRAGAAILGCLA
jgi:hypothetical protein